MKIRPWLLLGIACGLGCRSSQSTVPAPSPIPMSASFDVSIPEPGRSSSVASPLGTTPRPACLYSVGISGTVFPGESDARVLLSRAFVNVERHNDKQFDELILRLEPASPARRLGEGSTVEYRLAPTVDSAGPSITTWQPQDTIRLLLPWKRTAGDRWLLFYLTYRAVDHAGTASSCSFALRTDVLHF